MPDAGRNDPCPCGSGLKYKKCCRPKDEAVAAANRPRQTSRETVMPKLLRFAESEEFDNDHEIAEALFWGDRLEALPGDEADEIEFSDDGVVKYNSWFVWDLDIEDGITVSDMFLEQKGQSLDPAERAFIGRMRQSHLRLYQIEDVERDRGVTLRDLWTTETRFVHERLGTEQMVRWDVIGARVVPDDAGIAMFEGGLYLYPAADKADILRALKRYHRRYVKAFPQSDLAGFFKRHGFLFNHFWLDLVVTRALPNVVTAEGDDMLFCKSLFDIADVDALRSALAANGDLDVAEDGSFTWAEETDDFRRSLATLRIEGPRLILETTSRARDARARNWLEATAPGLTTCRATEIETLAQALARRRAAPSAPPEDDIPADVRSRIEREMMDQHYRAWLDEPIPALRGSTPRQAVASRTLTPILVDLLRDLSNRFERAQQRGEAGYDPAWIWDELGLRADGTRN